MKSRTRGLGLGVLTLLLGLSACVDGQQPKATGSSQVDGQNDSQQAGNAMASSTTPLDQGIVIFSGRTLADIEAQLGAPSRQEALKNDSPEVMGARLTEYAFEGTPVRVKDNQGNHRQVANLMLVSNSEGKILRLAVNPNPFGPAATRSQKGVTYSVLQAEIPAGVINQLKKI